MSRFHPAVSAHRTDVPGRALDGSARAGGVPARLAVARLAVARLDSLGRAILGPATLGLAVFGLAILGLAIPFLLAAGGRARAEAGNPFRFPYPIKVVDLQNGMRLVMVPMPNPGVVNYEMIVRAGSRNEVEPGRTGYAHFFEHMMFRGTERYPEQEYGRILATLGADGNADTEFDQTNYFMTLPASGLPRVIEVEADRFRNLRYDQEQFRKEAGAVLGEFAIDAADPGTFLMENRLALAFAHHTYRHPVMGFEADVRAMTEGYEYSRLFYDRFYRPEYCTLLLAGDIDTTQVERLVREHYSAWERGAYAAGLPAEPPLKESIRKDLEWNGPSRPMIEISFRTPGYSDQDAATASLELIGEVYFGRTSKLYHELVENRGLVESIGASFDRTRDPFLFTISASVKDPAGFEEVRTRILATIDDAARGPAPEERLQAAKDHLTSELAMTLETSGGVAWRVSGFIGLTGDPRSIERYYQRISTLTSADLAESARAWLRPDRSITLTLTGKGGRS